MYAEELKQRSMLSSTLQVGQTKHSDRFPFANQSSIYASREPMGDTEELEIQIYTVMTAINAIPSGTHTLVRLPQHAATSIVTVEAQALQELEALRQQNL